MGMTRGPPTFTNDPNFKAGLTTGGLGPPPEGAPAQAMLDAEASGDTTFRYSKGDKGGEGKGKGKDRYDDGDRGGDRGDRGGRDRGRRESPPRRNRSRSR